MTSMKVHSGFAVTLYICLVVSITLGAISVAAVEPKQVPVPEEAHNPPWLETRAKAQWETVDQFNVFYDFQFSDRVMESGIQFVHQIVDDAGKEYKLVHYDHGNGVVIADVDQDGLYDIYFVNQLGDNETVEKPRRWHVCEHHGIRRGGGGGSHQRHRVLCRY